MSPSVISQFLKQSYKGDNEAVARTILQYLEMARLRGSGEKHACFYKDMHNTQAVSFACFHAHCKGDIVLVYGDAGAGKTTALEHYACDHSGVIMVTANACTPFGNIHPANDRQENREDIIREKGIINVFLGRLF